VIQSANFYDCELKGVLAMNWPWVVGVCILAIVPGIVGGGLFWSFFENWSAVIVWEIVLFCILVTIIFKGVKKGAPAH
jgi:hypothetical protein